jgi:hypothetical protein
MRTRKTWIRNWILKRAVVGFAVAALVVPAAAQGARGGGVPWEQSVATNLVGPHQQPALPCAPNCALEESQVKAVDNELLEKHRGGTSNAFVGSELLEKNRGKTSNIVTPQVVSSPGFDWGDAAIGAGIALALVLLAGAAFETTRRLGKAQAA